MNTQNLLPYSITETIAKVKKKKANQKNPRTSLESQKD